MICSMTGYGSGKTKTNNGNIEVEIRSVNSRSCDIRCNFPREFLSLEHEVKNRIKKKLSRGQITVFLKFTPLDDDCGIQMDGAQLNKTIDKLKKIAMRAGFSTDGNIDTVINLIARSKSFDTNEKSTVSLREPLLKATKQALESLIAFRAKEGTQLINDIKLRQRIIERKTATIKKLAPAAVNDYNKKIIKRFNEIKDKTSFEFEPSRIAAEISAYADRVDITEEITRLSAHIVVFNTTIDKGGVIGKRLDFILQEMFREATTAGNKCNNTKVSSHVITIKEELEKMREQVQNIE